MTNIKYSKQFYNLIELYKNMANSGYNRIDGSKIKTAFSDMEIIIFKEQVKEIFEKLEIKLDKN